MRRSFSVGILAVLGFAALVTGADDFWVKKDWKTWSKAECKKMLEDSPWAKRFLIENNSSNGQLPGSLTDSPGFGLTNKGAGEVTYDVQLLTAAPVREAFIREQQIEQKYDKMSDAEKNAFDAKIEKQMNGTKADVIIVRVVFEANKPVLADAVKAYWQSLPPDTVPPNFYLVTEKGTRIPPLTFSFTKGSEAEFGVTFPRNLGAVPVISTDTKSLSVQFQNPPIYEYGEKPLAVEFKLDKMMWNGKLTY
jgi:hypothetical protein